MSSVDLQARWRSMAPYLLAALGLFLLWSNSFIASSYLLGGEGRPARLDFLGLTVARFLTVLPLCLLFSLGFRWRQSLELLRRHPWRLIACGLLGAPGYNLALYYGQQHGVPASVASLTTALLPLFVMLLAAIFLGERLTRRRLLAFCIACLGLVVIALSKGDPRLALDYGRLLAVTALAPLTWAIYSILAKPVMARSSPLLFTYLSITIGTLPLLVAYSWGDRVHLSAMTGDGWAAVLYLSILCTFVGYAVWTWLLRHLPASTLGFTVFLNPPLTTTSKLILSLLFPTLFLWQMDLLEWLGGGLALAGLALAVWPRR